MKSRTDNAVVVLVLFQPFLKFPGYFESVNGFVRVWSALLTLEEQVYLHFHGVLIRVPEIHTFLHVPIEMLVHTIRPFNFQPMPEFGLQIFYEAIPGDIIAVSTTEYNVAPFAAVEVILECFEGSVHGEGAAVKM